MKYILKKFRINTPEEELLNDLRRTAKKLGRDYLPNKLYGEHGNYNVSTFLRRFGSWNAALGKAGLKVKKLRRIPYQMLMENLKHAWDTLGRQPRYLEMVKPLSSYNVTIYTSRFGSWNNALEEFIKWQGSKISNVKSKRTNLKSKMSNVKSKTSRLRNGRANGERKRNRRKNKSSNLKNLKNLTNHVSKGMRFDILKRDNYKCKLCGASPATNPKVTLHIDHIIPRSKGGETKPKNLQTLCSDCNLGKGTKSISNE